MKNTLITIGLTALITTSVVPTLAETSAEQMSEQEQRTYSIFMLVKTTNAWLSLPIDKRFAFLNSDINPILEAYPKVKMRFFDTEGFNSRVTDVIVWETTDINEYQLVIEKLRESKFWGIYFDVVEILPGIENAYAESYQIEPYGQ